MGIKRIQVPIIVGLLLLMLIVPQSALADGPGISYVVVLDKTSTTATITWTVTTNLTITENRVNYGITKALGQSKWDITNVANPEIHLTGLTPDTTYFFEVRSTDTYGFTTDNNTGEYYSFRTPLVTSYNITLDPVCGVCGDLIEVGICGEVIGVTALVAAPGTYHISWDSLTNVKETFTATTAGSYSLAIYTPEARKGDHTVYLTDYTYAQKAYAIFTVLPSVKIDPEEGPVGTNVTLNGYGFTASQQLQIKFNDTLINTRTANNTTGSWNASYIVPATPAGGYNFEIQAKEGTVWVGWVTKYFKVIPQITVTPISATVGQTIKVDGTGFASDEGNIKVTFDGEVRKENIYADVDGSWSVTIAVPPLQSGRYIIDAWGTVTKARDVDDVTFTVSPGILIEPISAYVGDKITVKGGGFAPGETGIKVYFDGKLVTFATITANITGSWESSFTLEASTYGNHTISASGDITQPAVTNNLATLAKIEISPDEGAPGDSITLTGSGFSGNRKLTVTIGGTAALGADDKPLDVRTQTNGNVAVTCRVPASTAGKQTVRVTDEGGATVSSEFTVKKKVLITPQPISPENNIKLRSGEITFRWGGITGGSNITYILQLSDSPDGDTYVWRKSDIGTSTYTLPKEEALPKGTYYWWVKAVDNYDNESLWSSPSSFTVSPIPTWVWVVVGLVVLVGLMVVAYRQTKFRVTE